MVGETGAGKSSTLNTFITAVSNKEELIHDFRVAACNTETPVFEKSTTKTVSCVHQILRHCQTLVHHFLHLHKWLLQTDICVTVGNINMPSLLSPMYFLIW